jgi:hypothetical protein
MTEVFPEGVFRQTFQLGGLLHSDTAAQLQFEGKLKPINRRRGHRETSPLTTTTVMVITIATASSSRGLKPPRAA